MKFWSHFIRHAVAPAWARWEGSSYLRDYRTLLRTQFDRPEVIRQRQWRRIAQLIQHAYRTVPFWKDRFDQAGLQPEAIQSFEDFQAVPLLTKADLRNSRQELLSSDYRAASLTKKATSGSTGVSVEVVVDEAAQQWKRACTLRSDEWSGWRLGEPAALLWGNPIAPGRQWRPWLRNQLLERRRILDTLKMDAVSMRRFAESLLRSPTSLLFGHAHSLYLFAEFVRAEGLRGIRPRGIISSAMVLQATQRRGIEEVFGCPVTNRYGCEEVSLIACECERHAGLHVNSDGVFVEILRPDGTPAAAGEPGAVVVTDLVNRAMPMLRYRVGDVAALSGRLCGCGRGLPLIERLEGREADYVSTARGELVSGISLTDHFGTIVPGVAQLQIVQEKIDQFVFRIVRGPEFTPASQLQLRALVDERFGPETSFECEFMERIPQEPSGKYRFCISKVENPYKSPSH